MFNLKGYKNNKSGIMFLDVLVAMVIFLMIVLFVGRFQVFLKNGTIRLDKKIVFLETVNNELTGVYETDDWSVLTEKIIETNFGNIRVIYSNFIDETSYDTSKVTLKFYFDSNVKSYNLERSVYYDQE